MVRRHFVSGPLIAALMAAEMVARSKPAEPVEPKPQPEPIMITEEEAVRLERQQRLQGLLRNQGPETRQQRRNRERQETKAVRSFHKSMERKHRIK